MAAYWEIAIHSAYDMISKYNNCPFVFPPRFWSGNFFLIEPFPDHCLLDSSDYIIVVFADRIANF